MFGRYSDHQIPFMGVGRVELADNAIVALRLDLRQRIADTNYITLTGNVASTDDKLLHILRNPNEFIYGGGLTYGYKTFFGPIEGSICSSNRTKKPYIYLNIGFDF